MRRFASILFALLALPVAALAQTVTVTASNISGINNAPLAQGYFCLTPVSANGAPQAFTNDGRQYYANEQCWRVVGGVAAGVAVPDTSTTNPAIGYMPIIRDINRTPIQTYRTPFYPTAANASFDTWIPSSQVAALSSGLQNFGSYVPPTPCTSPSLGYTSDNTVYVCGSDARFHALPSSSGGGAFTGGTLTQALVLAGNPTSNLQAATKQYVDNSVSGASGLLLPLSGGTMTGAVILSGDPLQNNQAATKHYVDTSVAGLNLGTAAHNNTSDFDASGAAAAAQAASLPRSGGTVTGAITLPSDPATNLQAATKQYVDAHAGTGSASVTLSSVAGVFHRTQTTNATILSTTFNEGAAGTTLAGTHPAVYSGSDTWHFGDSGTVWSFKSGGGITATAASTGATGGAYIDIGLPNYTAHFIGLNPANNYVMAMLRYTDRQNMIFVNDNGGGSLQIFDYVNGSYGSGPIASGSMNTGDFYITLNGQTITISSSGYSPITVTIPGSDNATATKIGFTLEGGSGASLAGLTVTTPQSSQVACSAGYTNTDGSCSQLATVNSGVASDAGGKLTSLPELQTQTDSNGVTTIVCQEDMAKGKFDARCPKYAGGVYGPTPGEALQKVADAMMCYNAINNLHSSLELPTGNFLVGSSEYPDLQFGSGSYVYSAASSIQGYGTILTAKYNNYNVVQVNTGQSAICADGQTHTDNVGGGYMQGVSAHGCGDRNCVNWPGNSTSPADTGDYPSGGINQGGIFYGDSQGRLTMAGAYNNGGYGINCGGQDSECDHLFTQLNNEWLLYGRQQAGQTFDPSTFGLTGDVILTSIDGRLHDVETYGTNIEPGPEYGHLCGMVLGGGNVTADRLFLQQHEIGLCVPFGNGQTRVTNFRIDFSHGESILDRNGSTTYLQGEVDGYCGKQSVLAKLGGHCDGIDNSGGPGNVFGYVSMAQTNGSIFPTSYATGDIWAHDGGHYYGAMQAYRIEQPTSLPLGTTVEREWLGGYHQVTGDLWDVSVYNHIASQDTTATNITGLAVGRTAFNGEDIWIRGNHFDTLKSPANGGHWTTCSGQDLQQVDNAIYHFQVTGGSIYDNPPEMTEQCDTAAGGGTGSGTVSNGSAGHLAAYGASGTTVSDSNVAITDLAKYQAPNVRVADYTLASADSGNTVLMNCSAACTLTLPAPSSASFRVSVDIIGTIVPSVALGTGINFNSAATPPTLSANQHSVFYTDGTNWYGDDWGTLSGKVVNGVAYSRFYPETTLSGRVNHCISDAKAALNGIYSHECSSYGEPVSFSQTTNGITSEIDAGDATAATVTWRTPPYCNWPVYITNGTSSAIQQFGKSLITSDGEQRGGCSIINYSPANGLKYMYYTNTYNFVQFNGINFRNAPGQGNTLAGGAVMEIGQMADNSTWTNFGVADYVAGTYAIDMSGIAICCSANFSNFWLYGNDTGGSMLHVHANTALQGIQMTHASIGHSAPGVPLIDIYDTSGYATLQIDGVYEEGTIVGIPISGYSFDGAGNITVTTTAAHGLTAGSTVDLSSVKDATYGPIFDQLAKNANTCTVLSNNLTTTTASFALSACTGYASLTSTQQNALQAASGSITDSCYAANPVCTIYPMTQGFALNQITGGALINMTSLRYENIQSKVQNFAPFLWKINANAHPGNVIVDGAVVQHGTATQTGMIYNANLANPIVATSDYNGALTSYRSGVNWMDTLNVTQGVTVGGKALQMLQPDNSTITCNVSGVCSAVGGGGGGGSSTQTDYTIPSLTYHQPTAATSTQNQGSIPLALCGTTWNGTASADDCVTIQQSVGTGTAPTGTLTIGRTGAETVKMPAVASILIGSETVSSSATPTFSAKLRASYIVLGTNVTSFTMVGATDGQEKTLTFCQNATGGFTVTPPANVHGFFSGNSGQVGTTASKCSSQHFTFSSSQSAWLADSAGVVNE